MQIFKKKIRFYINILFLVISTFIISSCRDDDNTVDNSASKVTDNNSSSNVIESNTMTLESSDANKTTHTTSTPVVD